MTAPITQALARIGAPLTAGQLARAVDADFQAEQHFTIALQRHIRAGHIVPRVNVEDTEPEYSLVEWCAEPPPEQTDLERLQRILAGHEANPF